MDSRPTPPAHLPLTAQQKRMLFLHEIDEQSVAYNVGIGFRLQGPVDIERLFAAVKTVVEANEALRTSFALEDGVPVAWCREEPEFLAEVRDLRSEPLETRDSLATRIIERRLAERMDLRRGSLRVTLVRIADDVCVFAIMIHHIACDAWSLGLFVEQTWAAYEAAPGSSLRKPEVRAQYREYAALQHEQFAGAAYGRSVEHFVRTLESAPRYLELPFDRARPALQGYRGRTHSRPLPPELVEAVAEFAGRRRVTPFIVFHAAYLVLLRRYSGQRDLVVGVPAANRPRSEFAGSIGFFANALPLRTTIDDEAGFAHLVEDLRGSILDALDHQNAQIEDIIRALKLSRDASYSPLFQVMFAYQNAPGASVEPKDFRVEPILLTMPGARFDLTLTLDRLAGTLVGSFEYNEDLFDDESIVGMAESYEFIVAALLREPERPLGQMDLVPPRHRQQLLKDWASERLPLPDLTAFELIRDQAERAPDAIALRHQGEVWTYAELFARSGELADELESAGVGSGKVVAVLSERTPDLVAALLAVWQVGAAYVPLDPAYPSERLAFMLEDSGASAALVGDVSAKPAVASGIPVLKLERLKPPPAAVLAERRTARAKPGDLAYILYTSGSTGRPKGVCIEHRSVMARLTWAKKRYSREQLESVLASTSVCFDLSVFEIFVPLSAGATLVLVRDILELAETNEPPRVTLINTVPSAMAELLRLRKVPSSVRVVNVAGEVPSIDMVVQAYALPHVEEVNNLYGPTEDTIYSTSALLESGSTVVPVIGRPLPNSRAYVLDEYRNLASMGARGELYLAGDGLARGYHGRPELTAERFVEVEVEPGFRERVYRTGDTARFQTGGQLQFHGRRDHQVKLRGYRIELGEIDQALLRCQPVREAVTTIWIGGSGEPALVAYVVGEELDLESIRRQLAGWLPAYMVPQRFVQLASLPTTPNGKIARDRLPPPPETRGAGSRLSSEGLEAAVARVYEDLLGASIVGAEDEFFALGGHSLLAARAAARLGRELGVEVNIRDLFEFPRVCDIAAELERRVASARDSAAPVATSEPARATRAVLGDFPGFHVNCFVHCVVQSLNYFRGRPIHALNDVAIAFLGYRCDYRLLDPSTVRSATLYREIGCTPFGPIEESLDALGLRTERIRLPTGLEPLRGALLSGAFPILIGGTRRVVEPSIALLECDDQRGHFVALANDFGASLKTVPFDSPRLRPGEDVLVIHPTERILDESDERWVQAWRLHVKRRKSHHVTDAQAFAAWLEKYERRKVFPEHPLLCKELEGVNVAIGSEIGGFLRFEQHVLEQLPTSASTDATQSHSALMGKTLADYQHLANVLRRALIVAEELDAATLNSKIVEAVRFVNDRQRKLRESLNALG